MLMKPDTPFFLFDLDRISHNIRHMREELRPQQIFYAIKANSRPEILKTIADEGCGFEVNNLNELRKVQGSDCINSSPVTSTKPRGL